MMDNYENKENIQEPVTEPVQEPVAEPEIPKFIPEPVVEQAIPQPQYYTPPVAQPAKKKNGGKGFKAVLACLLVAALVVGGCGATAFLVNEYWEEKWSDNDEKIEDVLHALNNKIADLQEEIKDNSFTGNGNSVSGTPNVSTDGGLTPGQVYAQNVDAVVAISNQATTTNIYGQVTETASSGSGFIISENGYVVTNYHVAEGASKLTVILHNGTEYGAKLVGYDSANDVAVLKVEATGLPFVKLGSSKDLIVGDQVVAIGNPLGELTNSLTVGYVSAKDRDISTGGALINMIQTDAAINSGNSGGPLFNMKGEVVGINTAKYSGTSGSGATIEGISFAIPIDDVIKKVTDLKDYGYLTGSYLGITVSDTEQTYADYFGIPSGAYVRTVEPGYCAAKAGLQPKDVIVALGGHEITCINDLSRALEYFNPGDTVKVDIYRGGGKMTLEITLDERPQTNNSDAPVETPSQIPNQGNGAMPENGSLEEWWDYFFGNGNG